MLVTQGAPVNQALLQSTFAVRPVFGISHGGEPGAPSEAVDLSDRIVGLSISESMDSAAGSAIVTLARASGVESLSPLIAASRHRFVQGNRPVADPGLSVGLLFEVDPKNGFGPYSTGTVFGGRIDRVNIAASTTTLTITCRDNAANYLNRTLSQARHYGTAAGIPVEVVMGQILTDNGFSTFSLYVPVSPGYLITDFYTGDISIMEALRILAQQIGWDIRHFSQHQADLTFYDPGRTRTISDATIGATRYSAITELSIGDEDVRNSWDVYYPGAVTPAHAEDAASIARYGLRYARIGEDRTLNIRTLDAAQRLADSALADTKDPFASHEIRMPIYPVVQLNDLHTYQANSDEYDQDLTLAVVSYRHDWKAGPSMPTTTITARGAPLAAYREYRKLPPPPQVIVSATPPDPARYAPEGTVWQHVPGLA